MKSKWVATVRERFEEERGRLNLSINLLSITSKVINKRQDLPKIIEACQGVNNQIKELQLAYNNIGTEGAKHLSTANLHNLTVLDLNSNNIGAEGAKYLSSANFPNLKKLRLWDNNIKYPNKSYIKLLFKQKNIKDVYL